MKPILGSVCWHRELCAALCRGRFCLTLVTQCANEWILSRAMSHPAAVAPGSSFLGAGATAGGLGENKPSDRGFTGRTYKIWRGVCAGFGARCENEPKVPHRRHSFRVSAKGCISVHSKPRPIVISLILSIEASNQALAQLLRARVDVRLGAPACGEKSRYWAGRARRRNVGEPLRHGPDSGSIG